MMKFLLRSPEESSYSSRRWFHSTSLAGVSYCIRRMSLGRRIELTRMVRELGQKIEFLEAGDALGDRVGASLLGCEIDALYLGWGLCEVRGLSIDRLPATPETLSSDGPEELVHEIVRRIKDECGLSDQERKN